MDDTLANETLGDENCLSPERAENIMIRKRERIFSMKKTTILPLETNFGGRKSTFNAAVIRCDNGLVLVDIGLPGFLPLLEETMEKEGLKPGELKKVIVTHCDGDHVGALKTLVDKYPEVEVLSSTQQAGYLTGLTKNPRLEAAELRLAAGCPEPEMQAILEDMERLKAIETIARVTAVADGQGDRGLRH